MVEVTIFRRFGQRSCWMERATYAFAAHLLLLCVLLGFPVPSEQASRLGKRDLIQLSAHEMAALVSHPDPVRNIDPQNPSSHLSKILIPRPPDTANNTLVREYIISTLRKLNWHIEEDAFNASTPYGIKRFTNVIATKDPAAPRRVILAAHFDSKYFSTYPENQVRLSLALILLTLMPTAVVCWSDRFGCAMCLHAGSGGDVEPVAR